MKRNVLMFYVLLIFGFAIMVIFGVFLNNRKINNHIDIRHVDQLKGILVKVNRERSSAFGKLKDGRKVFFFDSDNFSYQPYTLNKFLKVGDSVVKKSQSDTLYIFRDQKEYFFVLGKSINK